MSERNAELLRAVAHQIGEHPETYDQAVFVCGTQACIAGWAMLLSHYAAKGSVFYRPDGTKVQDELAEGLKLLGLTEDERFLFWMSWKPAHTLTVPEALEKLAGGTSLDEVSQ